jgi:hypothetical protein
MALINRKTPEERAVIKEEQRREAAALRRAEFIEKVREAFFMTPAGRARLAFERGDHAFQYSIDAANQQVIVIPMVRQSKAGRGAARRGSSRVSPGSSASAAAVSAPKGTGQRSPAAASSPDSATGQQTSDPVAILNSVCHEGWELVNGSFVIVDGRTTVGYYLFKRCEANRSDTTNPWDYTAETGDSGARAAKRATRPRPTS